jgi:hypothetical protein
MFTATASPYLSLIGTPRDGRHRIHTGRDHSRAGANGTPGPWSVAVQKPSRKSALFGKRPVCPAMECSPILLLHRN